MTPRAPNSDPGVDAMISVIAHGTTFPVGNGSVANVTMGGKNCLIQGSWIGPAGTSGTAGEKCALKY